MDSIRQSVLDRMERHAANMRRAIAGAAVAELLLIVIVMLKLDFANRFEVLVFLLFVMTYTIMLLGLAALGAHVSRVGDRVLAALHARAEA